MLSPASRRVTLGRLATGLTALAILAMLAAPVQATSNEGTVKVKDGTDTGGKDNEPHVGCTFSIEGFGMEASSGTLHVDSWPPTGDKTTVLTDNWTADGTTGKDANHFVAGPYSLKSGHYKVFVSNAPGHEKMKVFWVDCNHAEVPVFPTPLAFGLAGVGALGGSWFVLRRRT